VSVDVLPILVGRVVWSEERVATLDARLDELTAGITFHVGGFEQTLAKNVKAHARYLRDHTLGRTLGQRSETTPWLQRAVEAEEQGLAHFRQVLDDFSRDRRLAGLEVDVVMCYLLPSELVEQERSDEALMQFCGRRPDVVEIPSGRFPHLVELIDEMRSDASMPEHRRAKLEEMATSARWATAVRRGIQESGRRCDATSKMVSEREMGVEQMVRDLRAVWFPARPGPLHL
jgi:hypothetical protein